MPTQENENISHAFGVDHHVIMSDGLDLDLGIDKVSQQSLCVGSESFFCTVRRVKVFRENGEKAWEFDLDVPSIDFVDLLRDEDIVLHYDDITFVMHDEYEIDLPDLATTIITFKGKRILSNHE
jgi:hypothetical protein